jgi:hypothetical protein
MDTRPGPLDRSPDRNDHAVLVRIAHLVQRSEKIVASDSTDLEFVEGLTHSVVSTPEPTQLSLLGFAFFAVVQFRRTRRTPR